MKAKHQQQTHILVIDCCEHVLSDLSELTNAKFASITSGNQLETGRTGAEIDLIVIGLSRAPLRRLYFSRLRQFFPETPILILRREKIDMEDPDEWIRGEFLLSDKDQIFDLELVKSLRKLLPLKPCSHVDSNVNYELVREITSFIADNFSDPGLNLESVATQLNLSPTKLSRVLNNQVGISFPQLLRNIRIQAAKRLLATRKYSVKEVSAKVGFSDSHYFSRTFKDATGISPSEYEYSPQELIFD